MTRRHGANSAQGCNRKSGDGFNCRTPSSVHKELEVWRGWKGIGHYGGVRNDPKLTHLANWANWHGSCTVH